MKIETKNNVYHLTYCFMVSDEDKERKIDLDLYKKFINSKITDKEFWVDSIVFISDGLYRFSVRVAYVLYVGAKQDRLDLFDSLSLDIEKSIALAMKGQVHD